MHIEPGIVTGAKLILSYGTAAAAGGYTLKLAWDQIKSGALTRLIAGSAITTIATFIFFQVLPHFPVGVSEVHFILGSTLFLLFGAAPAAIGLALGLLIQGMLLSPMDMPQFGMNLTTLLVPLFAMSALAGRVIPKGTRYTDVSYRQALALSGAFQAGVVAWVAFWAFYGQGFGATNIASVATFGMAYMMVILIEPLADLAVLAASKTLRDAKLSRIFTPRLFAA